MRLVIAAGALALAWPQAAAAQVPAAQAAGFGEVLLEVDATGVARTQADIATLFVTINCRGDTLQQAQARNEAWVAKMKAAARSAGVAEADLIVESRQDPSTRVALPVTDEDAETSEGTGKHGIRTTIEVRLRNIGRLEQLRKAFQDVGAVTIGDPSYSLGDDRTARIAAKVDAIARARADAEAYAATLGMRVGRIVKVSDRTRTDFTDLQNMEEMFRTVREGGRRAGRTVETRAKVSVDFILTPRP